MTADDQTFRLILALGMAAFVPVALYHRVRSQATREKLDRRQEGLFILLTLRPLGLAAMGGLVAFLLDPAWMAWSSLPLPVALRWAGVAVGVPTVALGIWTFRSLGRNITDTVVTRREHALITSGPYRYVRHPCYVTTALAFAANSLTSKVDATPRPIGFSTARTIVDHLRDDVCIYGIVLATAMAHRTSGGPRW